MDDNISLAEASNSISNPRRDDSGNTIWDCVYFGSYPQAEIIADEFEYDGVNEYYYEDDDIVEDATLFNIAENAAYDMNNIATATYNNKQIKIARVKGKTAKYKYAYKGRNDYYNWDDFDTYHYFLFEPIKWRVLNVSGDDAFLLADKAIACEQYNEVYESVTWETCGLRKWLNGYEDEDKPGHKLEPNFIDMAFSEAQQSAILTQTVENPDNPDVEALGGNDTQDKLFLLSLFECSDEKYGLVDPNHKNYSAAYKNLSFFAMSNPSQYAKAMGISWDCEPYPRCPRKRGLYLRTPAGAGCDILATTGLFCNPRNGVGVNSFIDINPALHLKLSDNLHTLAGTVNSNDPIFKSSKIVLGRKTINMEVNETVRISVSVWDSETGRYIYPEDTAINWSSSDENVVKVERGTLTAKNVGEAIVYASYGEKITKKCKVTVVDRLFDDYNAEISNPRVEGDNKIKWDCIYFGEYPQAEVVKDKSKYSSVNPDCLTEGDLIEDASLYEQLESAIYDKNGYTTLTIDNKTCRYKRLKRNDPIRYGNNTYWDSEDDYYRYHYFKCEPIKWRVLSTDGKDALLLADKVIEYGRDSFNELWYNCYSRRYLNGYGTTSIDVTGEVVKGNGIDYTKDNFLINAFPTLEQKNAIRNTNLYNSENATEFFNQGFDTEDKVFCLSKADVERSEYGFFPSYVYRNKENICKATVFAKAKGVKYETYNAERKGNAYWKLRTVGAETTNANPSGNECFGVNDYGMVTNPNDSYMGIRPALYLDLSKTSVWEPAGVVSVDVVFSCNPHYFKTHVAAVPATCATTGNIEYWECGYCKRMFDKNKDQISSVEIPIDPNNHIWDDGKITKSATKDSLGEKTYTCTNPECKATYTEPISYFEENSKDFVPTINIDDKSYVLNLATKEKYILSKLQKDKSDGKDYKITYGDVGGKSDSQYATINNKGIIVAKKPGVAHITVKKGNVEYKIVVNVFDPNFYYVDPKQKYYTVNVGSTVVPIYEAYNLKPVFSIDPAAIKKGLATIDPNTGKITAYKKGKVKVTATVGEGKLARKVTTTVKIYDPVLSTNKKTSVMAGKVLKASVKDGVKITTDWKSSNEAVATVDEKGKIYGKSAGTVTISCVNNEKILSVEITVTENSK